MSVVCRICFDVMVKDSQCQYYSSLNDATDPLAMKIKSKLKYCLPEFTVDLIKDSVICSSCAGALYVTYKFRKKFTETEKKIRQYMEEVNADSDKPLDINLVLKWLPKYEARMEHSHILHKTHPLPETVIPSNIYDVKRFDAKAGPDADMKSEHIDETDVPVTNNSAFEETLVEIDWNKRPDADIKSEDINETDTSAVFVEINWTERAAVKTPEIFNCSPINQMSESEFGGPDADINSEHINETNTSAANSSAFEEVLAEMNWNERDTSKNSEIFNRTLIKPISVCDSLEVGDADVNVSSDQPILMTATKPLKEELVDFSDNCDIADVPVGTEETEEASGMSYDYDHFGEFEDQFAGYTMDELYSKGLIAMPECSVVLDRLSDEEVKKWKRRREHRKAWTSHYKCFSCNFYTPRLDKFLAHMNNPVHKKKKYLSKTLLMEKTHKCGLCRFQTNLESNFMSHMNTHEKSVTDGTKCYQCDYVVTSRQDWRQHLKSHLSDTLIKCSSCRFTTGDPDVFNKHVKSRVARIRCSFVSAYNKRNHKKQLLDSLFSCTECDRSFPSRLKLRRHVCRSKNVSIYLEHNYSL